MSDAMLARAKTSEGWILTRRVLRYLRRRFRSFFSFAITGDIHYRLINVRDNEANESCRERVWAKCDKARNENRGQRTTQLKSLKASLLCSAGYISHFSLSWRDISRAGKILSFWPAARAICVSTHCFVYLCIRALRDYLHCSRYWSRRRNYYISFRAKLDDENPAVELCMSFRSREKLFHWRICFLMKAILWN